MANRDEASEQLNEFRKTRAVSASYQLIKFDYLYNFVRMISICPCRVDKPKHLQHRPVSLLETR